MHSGWLQHLVRRLCWRQSSSLPGGHQPPSFAKHGVMRADEKLRVADCIRLAVPKATEWQRIRDQIDAAMLFAGSDFVNVHGSGWLQRLVRPFATYCRAPSAELAVLLRGVTWRRASSVSIAPFSFNTLFFSDAWLIQRVIPM